MSSNHILDKHISEERIAELVDSVKQSPDKRDSLVELLPEQHPIYLGRGTNQTIRIRGYILAAFEQVGLPETAIPYILDELENGHDAYLVAGAAKGLRGLQNPSSEVTPFLLKAINNIWQMDDALTFEQYTPDWPVQNPTSALKEIFQSFKWLGSHAKTALPELERMLHDQINFSDSIRQSIKSAMDAIQTSEQINDSKFVPLSYLNISTADQKDPALVTLLEFEDQEGNRLPYGDFFSGAPSVVVFFYTRCNNPNKCSLTITKLGRLQQAIMEDGLEGKLKTAAITYDPDYDLPARMRAYGNNRGVIFNEDHRFLRSLHGRWKDLQDYFNLGVNFNGSIVNQHRIELFILDDRGNIAETFARLQWDIHEVLSNAKRLL